MWEWMLQVKDLVTKSIPCFTNRDLEIKALQITGCNKNKCKKKLKLWFGVELWGDFMVGDYYLAPYYTKSTNKQGALSF